MTKSLLTPLFSAGLALCAATLPAAEYANPVLHGDYPDPSIIRVGDDFWATATTSDWAPIFPLLHSRDLVHWQITGAVFQTRPEWSIGKYWAPEISQNNGKFFVYYVGHKKDGPLSIAVATADKPEGPWTDHGPLISQPDGSIDPMAVTDENGERYLVWKEDGNSQNKPTPIWAQKLSEDGTKLVGEMKELFHNDIPWENNLVEGPFVLRHGDYFYAFYSGAGCCGAGCSYEVGVARSKKLLGPWEKNPGNPIIGSNDAFKCPGHGSVVTLADGRTFFLYHSYDAKSSVFVGRQGMLDEVKWNNDAWPVVDGSQGPSPKATAPLKFSGPGTPLDMYDDFATNKLSTRWEWPQSMTPVVNVDNGMLTLSSNGETNDVFLSAVLASPTTTGDYAATTRIDVSKLSAGNSAGLFAFGDKRNALGLSADNGKLMLVRRRNGKDEMLATETLPSIPDLYVRMEAHSGRKFHFMFWNGTDWKKVGSDTDLDGGYLPPWDRGVRVALAVGGEKATAKFDWLKVINAQQ